MMRLLWHRLRGHMIVGRQQVDYDGLTWRWLVACSCGDEWKTPR